MPFCPKCGAETSGGNFCTRCGASLTGASSASAGSAFTAQQPAKPSNASASAGSAFTAQQPAKPSDASASDPAAYKLGWHKFLIYFALWLNAAIGLLNGVAGFSLAGDAPFFAVYGILHLATAVYAIYVRFQLARFKVGAPKKLLIFYVVLSLANLMTTLMDYALGASSSAGTVAGSIALLVISWRYYSSREALFVH